MAVILTLDYIFIKRKMKAVGSRTMLINKKAKLNSLSFISDLGFAYTNFGGNMQEEITNLYSTGLENLK